MRSADESELPGIQRWGAVVWPSFFAAGIATMCFFALFDPTELARLAWLGVEIDRKCRSHCGNGISIPCSANALKIAK